MPENMTGYIIFAVLIIVLIWVWSRWRHRGGGTSRLQSAINMISDVNENLKLLEQRRINPQSTRKFKTGAWRAYQDKMDYLEPETFTSLKDSFTLIEEMNAEIEVARKSNSTDSLRDIPLDKLRDPLTRSKQGLVKWLRENLQSESINRRGLFGF